MKTLEETLEEITPTPDPDFVADMERRMQMGFPPKRPPRFTRPRIVLPQFRHPAFAGALASAMLALLVTLSVVNNDGSSTDGGGGGSAQPQPVETLEAKPLDEDQVAQADSAGGAESAGRAGESTLAQPVPPGTALPDDRVAIEPLPPTDTAPNRRNRKVEQTAQMSLAADTDDFDQIADSVFRIADRRNGFVLQSSFTQGEDFGSGGYFELRVPADQLQGTLNALSRIATVRSRSESGTDVTGNYVAARDRLRIARAERRSLLLRLEQAETARAASAIRQRLEIVAGEITGLRNQLQGINERTTYAAVTVELIDKDAGPGAAKTETDEAVDDAVGSLEDILNFLIRALGILVPVALAGAVGWFAATRARRRQRERALA